MPRNGTIYFMGASSALNYRIWDKKK